MHQKILLSFRPKMNKIINYIRNPKVFFNVLLTHLAPLIKKDDIFIKLSWMISMDYPLDLKNPKTYNEKLQWLKLYYRKPEFTMMVDKVKVKEYVASVLGDEFIIPTIGVWDDPDKIDFDKFPEKFVLKCNHNSGKGMFICHDKSKMNVENVKSELRKGLSENYYLINREWPYKNVPRCVLAERFLEPSSDENDLRDYKLFCFDGKVKLIEVDYNRFIHHNRNLYSPDWKRLDVEIEFPSEPGVEFERPEGLEIAIEAAEKLSKNIPHVRVDFYIVNGHVYFGEMTFFHGSGHEKITPFSFDQEMGSWIHITNIMN